MFLHKYSGLVPLGIYFLMCKN